MDNSEEAKDSAKPNNKKVEAAGKRPVKRPKPIVEGINSPKFNSDIIFVKPTLTPQEKNLIKEDDNSFQLQEEQPMLLSKSAIDHARGRGSHWFRNLVILIIILALAYGGYKLYGWYLTRPSGVEAVGYPTTQPTPSAFISTTTSQGMASSTMATSTADGMTATSTFMLAGGLGTSTPATSTPGTMFAPTPTPLPQLTINSTPTGYLNVRSQPSTSGTIITQVQPGATYPYTASQNGWYEINLPSGQTGWVSGQYVTPQ